MANYQLTVISPQGKIFENKIEFLTAPAAEGSIGILANHAPMVALLGQGPLKIKESDTQEKKFIINSGVLEVNEQHQVLVLVDQITPT